MRKFKPPASETLPRTRDRDFVSSLFGHIGSTKETRTAGNWLAVLSFCHGIKKSGSS